MRIINRSNFPIFFAVLNILLVSQVIWINNHDSVDETFFRISTAVYLTFLVAPVYLFLIAKFFREIELREDKLFVNMHYIFAFVWLSLLVPEMYVNSIFYSLMLIYVLLFVEAIHKGSLRDSHKAIWDVLIILGLTLAYITAPLVYGNGVGIGTIPGNDVLLLLNLILLFAVYVIVYLVRKIHTVSSNFIGLLVINSIFLINIVTVGVMYATGFELGPTVMLHAGWFAVKIAIQEYWHLLLALFAFMSLFSYVFVKFLSRHSLPYGNHSALLLICLLIASNALTLFPVNDSDGSFPVFDFIEKSENYLTSNYYDTKDFIDKISFDETELEIIKKLGLNDLYGKVDNTYLMIGEETTDHVPVLKGNKHNLIVIYLESFQYNFTQQGGSTYPGLVPSLDNKLESFSIAENFFGSVTPTINGMISGFCGVNIFLPGNIKEDRANTPDPNKVLGKDDSVNKVIGKGLRCLSDVLGEAGYHQVYMQGAPARFAGKGDFLVNHQYDEVMGLDELYDSTKHEVPHQWGLHDFDLFKSVLEKLDTMPKDKPFNLTTLTLNSHFPGFESEQCNIYKKGNTLLNGIHCTDQALGYLLNGLKQRGYYDNTAIVIVGDHMQFASATNQKLMNKEMLASFFGRIYFAAHSPSKQYSKRLKTTAYTPDVAPSILELLNINDQKFVSGKSIFSDRKEYQHVVAVNFEAKKGKMMPSVPSNNWNECEDDKVLSTVIRGKGDYLTPCERKKIYYFEQKQVYRYEYLLDKPEENNLTSINSSNY
jgi:phosphoglycerol transferase MdoB-like AlkP superfamily enzyme